MKIQKTQTNLGFGNQYAIYERTVVEGLKPLGLPTRATKQAIRTLIEPIGGIEQGDGLFVFSHGKVNEDKATITLSGRHITGRRKEGVTSSLYDGEGSPVELTFPIAAKPETVKQTVLSYLANKLGIN